jgi:hypothetical protein
MKGKEKAKQVFGKCIDILEERGKLYGDFMDEDFNEYIVFTRGKIYRLMRDLKIADTTGEKEKLNEDTLLDTINYITILLCKLNEGVK